MLPPEDWSSVFGGRERSPQHVEEMAVEVLLPPTEVVGAESAAAQESASHTKQRPVLCLPHIWRLSGQRLAACPNPSHDMPRVRVLQYTAEVCGARIRGCGGVLASRHCALQGKTAAE